MIGGQHHTSRRAGTAAPDPAAVGPGDSSLSGTPRKQTIVVVDDSPDDVEIIHRCFLRSSIAERYEVVSFGSGLDFLQFMTAVEAGDKSVPTVLLLDINMPDMDGFETLSRLRAIPAFAKIPTVLFVSNSDRAEDAERAATLGSQVATKFGTIQEGVDFFDGLER